MAIDHIKQEASIKLRRLLNLCGREKKVFVIGFNKSASSSLHALFRSIARPSYHSTKWNDCDDLKLLKSYDCFSDGIPLDLAKLGRLFPSSKHILNVRDLDSWIYSRLAHIEREKEANTYNGGRGWDNTEYAIKAWIKLRNAHHLFVLSYFSQRPSDILVINFIRYESAATDVCRFLGYRGQYKRPKKNVNPDKKRPLKHREMFKRCIAELRIPENELKYDIYCPSLESKKIRATFPADSSLLGLNGG